jgi:hypothetical protein
MEERWTQGIVRASAAIGVAMLLSTTATAAGQPVAHEARACSLAGKYYSLGPTYVEKLSVSHTSCATGVKVIRAYDACRLKAGGVKGRCTSKVLGFKCSERRSSSSVQFVASARCTKRQDVVRFSYSENTA